MANTDFVRLPIDMRSLGSTGLRQFGGFVRDEILPQLTGQQGMRVYREMGDNDATIGGVLFIIDTLVRMVTWRVEEASSAPFDLEAAEHLESCMDDMDMRWGETICEMMSMVQYGYSLHEIVYKRRCGDSRIKAYRSKYSDGRIGWRGFPIRSQDTIRRWKFDRSGDIVGAEQMAMPRNVAVTLPIDRCILVRTKNHKNNPEGRSALRSAYRSWYKKQTLENIEGVGAERDLAGLPVAWLPPEIIAAGRAGGNTPGAAIYRQVQEVVQNIRADEQASLIMPLVVDEHGNKLIDLQLMSSSGAKQFDCDKIIQRYDQRIAMSLVADFLLMGQSAASTGSFAMHTDKTKIFARAIGTFLDTIRDAINDVAVPQLFRLNRDIRCSDYPRLEHGKIEQQDLKELGDFLTAMTAAGMPLFPNPELEDHICEIVGIPKPSMALPDDRIQQVQPRRDGDDDAKPQEVHDEASMEVSDPDGEDSQHRSTQQAWAPDRASYVAGKLARASEASNDDTIARAALLGGR